MNIGIAGLISFPVHSSRGIRKSSSDTGESVVVDVIVVVVSVVVVIISGLVLVVVSSGLSFDGFLGIKK